MVFSVPSALRWALSLAVQTVLFGYPGSGPRERSRLAGGAVDKQEPCAAHRDHRAQQDGDKVAPGVGVLPRHKEVHQRRVPAGRVT